MWYNSTKNGYKRSWARKENGTPKGGYKTSKKPALVSGKGEERSSCLGATGMDLKCCALIEWQ